MLDFAAQPWQWIGGAGCVILLRGYLLALRSIGLGTSYAAITSMSLVTTSIASMWLFGEKFPVVKLAGMTMIIIGVIMVVRGEYR